MVQPGPDRTNGLVLGPPQRPLCTRCGSSHEYPSRCMDRLVAPSTSEAGHPNRRGDVPAANAVVSSDG
eukprot:scaffold1074_cov409-Prasinococcus_capsulatus_cf.AAC.7